MSAAHKMTNPATPDTASLKAQAGSLIEEARAGAQRAARNATQRARRPVDLIAIIGYAIMAGYVAAMVVTLAELY